jgi:hypothetical protein
MGLRLPEVERPSRKGDRDWKHPKHVKNLLGCRALIERKLKLARNKCLLSHCLFSVASLNQYDLARAPGLGEERFERAV